MSSETFAYLRVSTIDQDVEKNKMDILKLANEKRLGQVEFIEEKVSGKVPWRKRKIATILEQTKDGDAIIISELSRLGRSMLECMEIISLALQKNVHIYVVKGNWQLDNSIQSKVMAMAFAMAAEIERELLSQRTKEALAARKRQGVILGRPKGVGKSKLDPHKEEIIALLNNGSTKTWIANRYKTSRRNLSYWMQQHGIVDPAKKNGE